MRTSSSYSPTTTWFAMSEASLSSSSSSSSSPSVDAVMHAAPTAPADGVSAPSPSPLEALQSRLETNQYDFEAHCEIVTEYEKLKDYPSVLSSLRSLLSHFPLCFGYWQRLARHQAASLLINLPANDEGQAYATQAQGAGAPVINIHTQESVDALSGVMEEGLLAIPHSHELWTFWVTELTKFKQAEPENIRRLESSNQTFRTHDTHFQSL